jgi:predicted nucleotidyltransferase
MDFRNAFRLASNSASPPLMGNPATHDAIQEVLCRQVRRLPHPLHASHPNARHAKVRRVKAISQSLLDEVANRLANELHPDGIWRFGSHAWGTPDEGSDLDLFVVVPESNEPPVERMRRAHRCLRGLGIAKDVLVKTRQEFDRLRALPSTLDYLVFHRGRERYG